MGFFNVYKVGLCKSKHAKGFLVFKFQVSVPFSKHVDAVYARNAKAF